MSYREAKAARHRELVAAIHGTDDDPEPSTGRVSFDAGVRNVQTDYVPRCDRQLPPSWPSDERGWTEYELEDGAELLMPWLRGK